MARTCIYHLSYIEEPLEGEMFKNIVLALDFERERVASRLCVSQPIGGLTDRQLISRADEVGSQIARILARICIYSVSMH